MLKNRKFRFSAFITLHAVAAALLCYVMSYWQATRYNEKKAYLVTLEARQNLGLVPLDEHTKDWQDLVHATVHRLGPVRLRAPDGPAQPFSGQSCGCQRDCAAET